MSAIAPPILVVDDDADNRTLLRTFLEAEGHTVVEVETGEKALELIAQQPMAIVLLDVMLPGVSGFDVCRRIKRDKVSAGTPVLMVTALGDTESRSKAFDSDADEFIAKPVFRRELIARVRALLRLRRTQSEKETALLALEAEKRDRVQALFERYLSKNVAEHLLRLPDPERAALLENQGRVNCAVMFTDLRDFTAITDALAPAEVVALLTQHFNSLTGIAHRHRGTVFNMTGDGLLIGFGVPIAEPEPCVSAINAAVEMQQDFRRLRDSLRERRSVEIGLGIGINFGPVIMGDVGSERFVAFTIIGDTVNVAARVQELADPDGVRVTQAVRDAAPALAERYAERDPLRVVLRGKARDQTLYSLRVP